MSSSVDNRTLAVVITSLLTALTSAASVSTGTLNTSIGSQITADTGLSTSANALLSQIQTAIGLSQPSSQINNFFK